MSHAPRIYVYFFNKIVLKVTYYYNKIDPAFVTVWNNTDINLLVHFISVTPNA